MALLQKLGTGQGYLKAGLLGFSKSGKTFTATLLAIAVRQLFGFKEPIAFFDTESGSEYVAPLIKELTGEDPVGIRSRSFVDLMEVAKECEGGVSPILLVDSITHVWRELCDAYLKQLNEGRVRRGWQPRTKLEFQDWPTIKQRWSQWTDWYLNSRVHVCILGRAGFEYDMQANDETGKKELVKTGTKMKVETEFGFEPSLLVEMERVENRGQRVEIAQRAVVLGDRFGEITGHVGIFRPLKDHKKELDAVANFFLPHLKRLKPGALASIDTSVKTDLGLHEGDEEWASEKRQRIILCEEIQGELLRVYPGQTAKEKQAKMALIEKYFGTKSWTRVESTDSGTLRVALRALREELNAVKPPDGQEPAPDEFPVGSNGES